MGLFKPKEPRIHVKDKVWINVTAKWKACMDLHKANPAVHFIVWFPETYDTLQSFFTEQPAPISMAREVNSIQLKDRTLVFAEHYPLLQKEQDLFTSLHLKEATVYTSLDEAVFQLFGADNILSVVQKLGLKEDEAIEHSFVSAAIRNAQDKLQKKITLDHAARSQEDWLHNNRPNT